MSHFANRLANFVENSIREDSVSPCTMPLTPRTSSLLHEDSVPSHPRFLGALFLVSARESFHRDRRQVPSGPSSLSVNSPQRAFHKQSHLLVLRILFVSSRKTCCTCAPSSAGLSFFHTWCEAICAPDPRASFVIHVHFRGLLSCRGGTFVYGAILLFGSYRSLICDWYESGSRCCFTRMTKCLVVIGHRSANSAY